jgi:uncharacterized protein (TIGR04255 family)
MAFTPTPLTAPAPKPVRFEKSPLALVVCQIRFEHLGLPDEPTLKTLKEALSEEYPVMQPLQSVEIQVGAPGAQASTQRGWRLASLDQGWSVALLEDALALETTNYKDWEDFDGRLRRLMAAIDEALAPKVEVRLGLRYVNELRLEAVEKPADWSSYLRSELVALTASELISPSVVSSQQTLQLDAGDGAVLNMRHGSPGSIAEPLDQPVYLLDFDCFREGQRPLEVDGLLAEGDRFNTLITSVFQWCLTEALWKELDPRDK